MLSFRRISARVATVMLFLSALACASGARQTEGEAESPYGEEAFDFRTLEDDDLTVGLEAGFGVGVPQVAPAGEVGAGAGSEKMRGWRVQIYTSQDYLEAERVEKLADSLFTEEVYLIFDTPNYKIRIGDYLTRDGADQMQRIAIERGFRNAWVIRGEIVPRWKREQGKEADDATPGNTPERNPP